MKLDIDMSELRTKLLDPLEASPLRVRNAAATALTRVAVKVRDAQRAEMVDVFDRPKPYTLNAVFVKPASGSSFRNTLEARPGGGQQLVQVATNSGPIEAVVGIKDDASEGRAPVRWLRWQVQGGLRTLTGWEKQLVKAGAMDGMDRAVPGRFARLDAYGNISPGQLQQIFSQLRIETGRAGSTRIVPALSFDDTGRERRQKIGKIKASRRRAGGQFIAFPAGRGKLKPGIYLVRDTAFGRSDPKPIIRFVSKAQYESGRFDFYYVAGRVIDRELIPTVTQSVAEAVLRGRR